MPDGHPQAEHFVVVLQADRWLRDPSVRRVLVAPVSTSSITDPWSDYIIEPGKQDHCSLTRESAVVLACTQPVTKEAFEGGEYKGFLDEDACLQIVKTMLKMFGFEPSQILPDTEG